MALFPGSPAIDTAVNCPATDQRGVSRPQGAACDAGAYELIQQAGPVFSGFLAPVSNPPTVNTVKAGQAIPVKFSLGGDWGLNIIASGYPASRQVPCPLSSGVSTITETQPAGNSRIGRIHAGNWWSSWAISATRPGRQPSPFLSKRVRHALRLRLWIGNAADSRGRCFRMPETQGSKVRLRLVGHGASFYTVIREKLRGPAHPRLSTASPR